MSRKNYSKFSNNKQNVVVDKPSFDAQQLVEPENIIDNNEITVKGYVANCEKLNVRKEPNTDSEIVCIIDKDSEVVLESIAVINGFYKINTAYGVEGYCMKEYIEVK